MTMNDNHDNELAAVDVRPIKAGLRELAARMPREPEHVHAFGKLLAAYTNDKIYPSTIAFATMLLMNDIRNGKSGYSSAEAQIPAKLVGMPPVVLAVLELAIPRMLRAAAGPEHVATAELLIAALESA
jgi:hypothetical protein